MKAPVHQLITVTDQTRPTAETRRRNEAGITANNKAAKLGGISDATKDISEAQHAESKLVALQCREKAILGCTEEGIFGIDLNGRCSFVNTTAINLLGYSEDEIVGKFEHALFHHSRLDGEPYPSKECPLCAALHDGQICHGEEEFFWRKDGTYFPVKYTCNPIRNMDKQVIGIVVTFQDITKSRQLETELLIAQKLEAVGQLAAGIAHEINTPAQYVSDNIQFIHDAHISLSRCSDILETALKKMREEGLYPELVKKFDLVSQEVDSDYLIEEYPLAIEQSLEGINNISKIVRAMKEFSHPGQDSMEATDINHIVKNTITVSRNEWKYSANIITELDEDLPLVYCYAQSIGQALLNIIINASHAIAENSGDRNGEIVIETKKCHEHIKIMVSDNGKGIPKKIRTRIFDPFFTTKGVGKGTGHGLAMVHSTIVEQHNGKIRCDSKEGAGTTFTIHLPLNTALEKTT